MTTDFRDTSDTLRVTLERTAEAIGGKAVTLREILALIGEQGLLLMCAVLTVPFLLPVSIPGVSTVFGLAIILISIGITANRAPWLPRRIMDRPIDAGKLVATLRKGAGIVRRIEAVIRPRLTALTGSAAINRFNGLMLILGGVLLMFPLGLVPFSNTLPAFAILFLCIGMSQRDGLFVLAGYAATLATIVYFSLLAYLAVMAGQGVASMLGGT
ncbi:MAG: protein exod [Hyphomicrobiales bacterium]|nr:MAG: protein exod [Hyphomicrobiales bacterium]